MKVLDIETTWNKDMGKKKHKLRKQSKENADQSETSDDGKAATINPVKRCSHITKGINFAAMRKSLGKQKFAECAECMKATHSSKKGDNQNSIFAETSDNTGEEGACLESETSIWVCLQCGHQGCDRNSTNRHALRHFNLPHSSCHSLVINLHTWLVWCYTCDEEIVPDRCKRVVECLDFLKRQDGEVISHDGSRDPALASSSSENHSKTTGQSAKVICSKVKGLNNLGNTCFFNAVMQNLSKTPHLDTLMADGLRGGRSLVLQGNIDQSCVARVNSDPDYKPQPADLPSIEVTVPAAGPLTTSVLAFLREMNANTKASNVNPNHLFGQVCKKAPRFKGFQQQDSHELLRYLLDNIKTEEIKRVQSGILKRFKLPENINPKKVDADVKTKIKEYGRRGKYTLIDRLFGGVLLSTIICDECHQLSTVFEPFLDLSLSITEEKPARPTATSFNKKMSNTSTDAVMAPSGSSEKLNKQQQKKMKKLAKREKKLAKNRVTPTRPKMDATNESAAGDGKSSETGANDPTHSDRDDTSDADVEDNLESDASRTRMLAQTPDIDIMDAASQTVISNQSTNNSGCVDSMNRQMDKNDESHIRQECVENGTADRDRVDVTGSELTDNASVERCENLSQVQCNELSDQNGNTVEAINGEERVNVDELSGLCSGECNGDICETFRGLDVNERTASVNGFVEGCEYSTNAAGRVVVSDENCDDLDKKIEDKFGGCYTEDCNMRPYDYNMNSLGCCVKHKVSDSTNASDVRSVSHDANDHATSGSIYEKSQRERTQSESIQEVKRQALSTLVPRYHPSPRECSVLSCLNQFTSAELLTGNNKFGCNKCTVSKGSKNPGKIYSNASKHYLIFSPPPILTLHFKRFEQVGFTSRKVNRHVDFDFILNLSPFCSALSPVVKNGQRRVVYSLYGVVEHSGRLTGGHYTAYVKVRTTNSHVKCDFLGNRSHLLDDFFSRVVESQNVTKPTESAGFQSNEDTGSAIENGIQPNATSQQTSKWTDEERSRMDCESKTSTSISTDESAQLNFINLSTSKHSTDRVDSVTDATNCVKLEVCTSESLEHSEISDNICKPRASTQSVEQKDLKLSHVLCDQRNSPNPSERTESGVTGRRNDLSRTPSPAQKFHRNSATNDVGETSARLHHRCTETSSSESPGNAPGNATIPTGRWYHVSDSHVSEVTETSVRRAQAYMLFYERIV